MKNNLNNKQRKLLRDVNSLVRNNEIIICRADKDGKIIVITLRILSDGYECVTTQQDNLQGHFDRIRSYCERFLINLFENDCTEVERKRENYRY